VKLLADLDSMLTSTPLTSTLDWADQPDLMDTAGDTQSVALNTRVLLAPTVRRTARLPWFRQARLWAIAGVLTLAAILLAVILQVTTNYGTVKIELSDQAAKVNVQVDRSTIAIAELKEPLRLKAGRHRLIVTSRGFSTVVKSFEVKRGSLEIVKVTLIPITGILPSNIQHPM
jgi:hypothetical protein